MAKKRDLGAPRQRRHRRVRAVISGTSQRPRLNVFRSSKNIYAQIIDDSVGKTIASASTNEAAFEGYGGNIKAAREVGKLLAKRAADAGVTVVVFDRGGYLYHGRVRELAEGAREGGLQF